MPTTRSHVILRRMTLNDLDQVLTLDRLSFPTPWPAQTYHYELSDNERACLFVLEAADAPPLQPVRQPAWWERLLGLSPANGGQPMPLLCGYSGMWHIAGESHISTIAVHPDWRGRKLGELLIWNMFRQALHQKAEQVTLEVRVSNEVAQRLYRKYGFEVMGVRKGYYRDNGEDAYMMGITALGERHRQHLIAFGNELAQHVRVTERL